MKFFFNNLIAVFLFLLFESCKERDLGIVLPFQENKMVVYSDLNPNRVVEVYINKVYPSTGKYTILNGLPGANVILYEDGKVIETLMYSDSGRYVSLKKTQPKTGSHYFFEITLEGFPKTSTLPVEIPLGFENKEIVLSKDSVASMLSGKNAKILKLKWKTMSKNNCLVKIEGEFNKQYLSISSYNVGKDYDIEDGCSLSRSSNRYIFNNECFNKNEYVNEFGLDTYGFLQNIKDPFADIKRYVDTYKISISTISDSYFKYLYYEEQPSDLFLAFQLPKNRFSNVKNGYGVVIASNTSTFILSVK